MSLAAPVITAVSLNGTFLTVTWTDTNASGTYANAGASLWYGNYQPAGNSPTVQPTGSTLTVTWDISKTVPSPVYPNTFVVTVTDYASNGQKAATSAPFTFQIAAPQVSAVSFTAGVAEIAWNNAFPIPNIEYYAVTLIGSDGLHASAPNVPAASAISGSFLTSWRPAIPLDGMETYQVVVTPYDFQNNPGPASALMPVITAATYVNAVSYTPSGPTVGYTAVALSSAVQVTGYQLLLMDGEVEKQIAAAATPGTAGTLTLTGALTSGRDYSLRLRAQWVLKNSGVTVCTVTGPLGKPTGVIAGTPTVTQASYDGALISAAWNAIPEPCVDSYAVALQSQATSGGSWTTVNTWVTSQTQWLAPIPVNTSYSYRILVAGRSEDLSLGPQGTPLAVVMPTLPAAVFTEVAYDGSVLTLAWTLAPIPHLAYLQVAIAGDLSLTAQVEGGSASLPLSLSPTGNYTVTLTAVDAAGFSSVSNSIPILAAAATITSVAVASGAATVQWAYAGKATPSGFMIGLFDGDALIASKSVPATPLQASLPVPAGAGVYAVRAWAMAAVTTGPMSGPVAALATAPTLAAVDYDGETLSLEWSPLLGSLPASYTVTVDTLTPIPVGSAVQCRLPMVLNSAVTHAISVAPVADRATGVAATGSLAVGPVPTSTAYDGTTLTVVFPVTGSGLSYVADVKRDGETILSLPCPAAVSGVVTATFALSLPSGSDASVAVRGVGVNQATTPGQTMPILTQAPTLMDHYYSGSTLTLSWEGAAQAYATATRLTIAGLASGNVFNVALPAYSQTVTPGATLAAANTVTAQAIAVLGGFTATGPMSAAINPVLGDSAFAVLSGSGTATASNDPPMVIWTSVQPPASANNSAIVIGLPTLLTANPAQAIASGPFTLGTSGTGPYPYSLTLTTTGTVNNVWNFSAVPATGPMIRPWLQTGLIGLIQQVEAASPVTGAVAYLRQAIALNTPLTYDEQLYCRYGLYPAGPYVDLQPGMTLRLDAEMWQSLGASAPTGANGYLGNGQSRFDLTLGVISNGVANVAFDAFLARLSALGVMSDSYGVGGVIDLSAAGRIQPYYRLFLPTSYPSPSNPSNQTAAVNAALFGAATQTLIEQQTTYYLANKQFNTGIGSLTFFRGRDVAVPLVSVRMNGDVLSFPVGTTLRQALIGKTGLPLTLGLTLQGLSVRRQSGVLGYGNAATFVLGQRSEVDLTRQAPVVFSPSKLDWLDLPLFGGDVINLQD